MEGMEMDILLVIVPYLDGQTLVRCLGLSTLLRDRILEMDTPLVRTYKGIKRYDITTTWDMASINDHGLFAFALNWSSYVYSSNLTNIGFIGRILIHCPRKAIALIPTIPRTYMHLVFSTLGMKRIRRPVERRMAEEESYAIEVLSAFRCLIDLAIHRSTSDSDSDSNLASRSEYEEQLASLYRYSDRRIWKLLEEYHSRLSFYRAYSHRLRHGVKMVIGRCRCGSDDPYHSCSVNPSGAIYYLEDSFASGRMDLVQELADLYHGPMGSAYTMLSIAIRCVRHPEIRSTFDRVIPESADWDPVIRRRTKLTTLYGREVARELCDLYWGYTLQSIIDLAEKGVPLIEILSILNAGGGLENLTKIHTRCTVIPILIGERPLLPPIPYWNFDGEMERRAMRRMDVFRPATCLNPDALLFAGLENRSKIVCELGLKLGAKVTSSQLHSVSQTPWLVDLLRRWKE